MKMSEFGHKKKDCRPPPVQSKMSNFTTHLLYQKTMCCAYCGNYVFFQKYFHKRLVFSSIKGFFNFFKNKDFTYILLRILAVLS